MHHLDPITRTITTFVLLGLVAYVVLFDVDSATALLVAMTGLATVVTAFRGGGPAGTR